MVIDSEPTVRLVITRILERGDHTVRATEDFTEAVSMLRGQTADLVLTNVFLRGIAGHDAMRRLRVEFPRVKVLMVSGLPDEAAIAEWAGEARFDIFPKPFLPGDLLEKVRQVLQEPI